MTPARVRYAVSTLDHRREESDSSEEGSDEAEESETDENEPMSSARSRLSEMSPSNQPSSGQTASYRRQLFKNRSLATGHESGERATGSRSQECPAFPDRTRAYRGQETERTRAKAEREAEIQQLVAASWHETLATPQPEINFLLKRSYEARRDSLKLQKKLAASNRPMESPSYGSRYAKSRTVGENLARLDSETRAGSSQVTSRYARGQLAKEADSSYRMSRSKSTPSIGKVAFF